MMLLKNLQANDEALVLMSSYSGIEALHFYWISWQLISYCSLVKLPHEGSGRFAPQ
jgi:hypothetical protein